MSEHRKAPDEIDCGNKENPAETSLHSILESKYQKLNSVSNRKNLQRISFKPFYVVYELHGSIPGSEIFPPVFDVFESTEGFLAALRKYLETIKNIAFEQDEDWYDTYPEDEDEYVRVTSDSNEDTTRYSFEAFNVIFNILNTSDEPSQIAESIFEAFSEYRFDENTLNDYGKEDLEELLDEYPLLMVSAWATLFKQPVDPDLFYAVYVNGKSLNDSAPRLDDEIGLHQ